MNALVVRRDTKAYWQEQDTDHLMWFVKACSMVGLPKRLHRRAMFAAIILAERGIQ